MGASRRAHWVTLSSAPCTASPKVGKGVLRGHCTESLGELLAHLGNGVLVLWGHLVNRLTYGCRRGNDNSPIYTTNSSSSIDILSPLSTTAVHILVPSTTTESGTTAIVTLNQSLVLTTFCLDFYDFGHGCSELITPNDCVSFCISSYFCVWGLYN